VEPELRKASISIAGKVYEALEKLLWRKRTESSRDAGFELEQAAAQAKQET